MSRLTRYWDALVAFPISMINKPVADVKLERWDVSYYIERVRQAR